MCRGACVRSSRTSFKSEERRASRQVFSSRPPVRHQLVNAVRLLLAADDRQDHQLVFGSVFMFMERRRISATSSVWAAARSRTLIECAFIKGFYQVELIASRAFGVQSSSSRVVSSSWQVISSLALRGVMVPAASWRFASGGSSHLVHPQGDSCSLLASTLQVFEFRRVVKPLKLSRRVVSAHV